MARSGERRDTGRVDEQILHGGIANKGAVTRLGPHVLRPASEHSAAICTLLSALRKDGFSGASEPAGYAQDGRERLIFIEGDVPLPPYPDWAQTDEALTSTAELIGRPAGPRLCCTWASRT
ncbi:MAG: hypothetical protein ACC652_13560 [Acidimicrobiales bacterium]